MLTDIFGYLGAFFLVTTLVPQIKKTYQEKVKNYYLLYLLLSKTHQNRRASVEAVLRFVFTARRIFTETAM